MAVIRPDSLPEEWHCPYCNYGEYRNRDDWERRAADHIDQCDKRPLSPPLIPHDRHRDDSETEIGPDGVRSINENIFDTDHGALGSCLLVVSGPDGDDEIQILAAPVCYLSRDAAGRLRDELTRRLRTPPPLSVEDRDRVLSYLPGCMGAPSTRTVPCGTCLQCRVRAVLLSTIER